MARIPDTIEVKVEIPDESIERLTVAIDRITAVMAALAEQAAVAVEKFHIMAEQLERIQISEGPCDSMLSQRINLGSERNWYCHLNALHTGSHTDGKKQWTDDAEGVSSRHEGPRFPSE